MGTKNNVLVGSDTELPSMDDWGTFGDSGGELTVGFMLHRILDRTVCRAIPNWKACWKGTREQRVAKKAWRFLCICRDPRRQMNIVVCVIVGGAIENLIQYMTWIDEQGNGLFDVQLPDTSPFMRAMTEMTSFLLNSNGAGTSCSGESHTSGCADCKASAQFPSYLETTTLRLPTPHGTSLNGEWLFLPPSPFPLTLVFFVFSSIRAFNIFS